MMVYETVFIPVSYGLFFLFSGSFIHHTHRVFPRSSNLHKCSSPYLGLASRNICTMATQNICPKQITTLPHSGWFHQHKCCLSIFVSFFLSQDQIDTSRNCCLDISFVVDWGITASWPRIFCFICTLGRVVHIISCLSSCWDLPKKWRDVQNRMKKAVKKWHIGWFILSSFLACFHDLGSSPASLLQAQVVSEFTNRDFGTTPARNQTCLFKANCKSPFPKMTVYTNRGGLKFLKRLHFCN